MSVLTAWRTHHGSTYAAMYQNYGYVAEAHIAMEPCSHTRSLPVMRLALKPRGTQRNCSSPQKSGAEHPRVSPRPDVGVRDRKIDDGCVPSVGVRKVEVVGCVHRRWLLLLLGAILARSQGVPHRIAAHLERGITVVVEHLDAVVVRGVVAEKQAGAGDAKIGQRRKVSKSFFLGDGGEALPQMHSSHHRLRWYRRRNGGNAKVPRGSSNRTL